MFIDKKHLWEHLIPQNDGDSTALVQSFFGCVASLMSIQLREMVVNSLADFLQFFHIHAAGNDFEGIFFLGLFFSVVRHVGLIVMELQIHMCV